MTTRRVVQIWDDPPLCRGSKLADPPPFFPSHIIYSNLAILLCCCHLGWGSVRGLEWVKATPRKRMTSWEVKDTPNPAPPPSPPQPHGGTFQSPKVKISWGLHSDGWCLWHLLHFLFCAYFTKNNHMSLWSIISLIQSLISTHYLHNMAQMLAEQGNYILFVYN